MEPSAGVVRLSLKGAAETERLKPPRRSGSVARRAAFGTMTGVSGVRIGHAEDPTGTTGVTAILFDRPAPTAVDVRGGASCTYDVASLDLEATFGRRWAVFFAGGSVYGLDAARGIRTFLLDRGSGHRAFRNPNPIVPISGACLFDLPPERSAIADYLPLGFEAARSATRGPVRLGRVGAGAGAAIGKYRGRKAADPGGVGSLSSRIPGVGTVGVLAVVNAVGGVRDPERGRWVAGPRDRSGAVIPPDESRFPTGGGPPPRGTTLVSIATDAPVDRRTLRRLAIAGQTGIARTVVPSHTATDGDVVFASSTTQGTAAGVERYPGAIGDRLGAVAAALVAGAILEVGRRRRPNSRRTGRAP